MPFYNNSCVCDLLSLMNIIRESNDVHYIGGLRSQLHPKAWLYMLSFGSAYDPDILYLLNGIYFGFKVVDVDAKVDRYFCKNYSSCILPENRKKLKCLLQCEVEEGKLSVVESRPFCVHALGVIAKKGTSKIRPITDCSQPELRSVNSFMDSVQNKFHYVTVGNIVSHILEGKCIVMSTVDLASAYRSIMIRPTDRGYFGLCFEDQYYVDNCLCFGSRCAPFIFNRITDSVCRYLCDQGILCWNYLDDVICLSRDLDSGIKDQLALINTLRRLGFYIAWNKVHSPSYECVYLGIEINTVEMCLRLPSDRLERLRAELGFWKGRRKAMEKQLQILAGHMNHCAKIIQGANLYMHFLYTLLAEARSKCKVKLSEDFHDDLSWWTNLAFSFNCVPLVDLNLERSWISVASGSFSVLTEGAVFDTQLEWPCVYLSGDNLDICGIPCISDDNYIGFAEGEGPGLIDIFLPEHLVHDEVAVEISLIWAYLIREKKFSNCTIEIFCVRKQTWLSLKKSRVKNNLLAMLLRHIFWWAMERNVKLEVYHAPLS